MTTLIEARKLCYDTFLANFAPSPAVPVVLENESAPSADEFVRVAVRTIDRRQHTLGAIGDRRFRTNAGVYMTIHTAHNSGIKRSDQLAHLCKDIFEGKDISGIDFTNGSIRDAGVDLKWYKTLASVLFYFDETK